MFEHFDNVIYLTFMIVLISLIYKFSYKVDHVPISSLWWFVIGAWVSTLILYILKK